MSGVQNLMKQLGILGSVLALLLAIPGGLVIDTVLMFVLIMFQQDPMARAREDAKKRMRAEIEMQRSAIKIKVVNLMMTQGHSLLKDRFQEIVGSKQHGLDAASAALTIGAGSVQDLFDLCDEIATNAT